MKNHFSIHILPTLEREQDAVVGEICIGDFKETFTIPTTWWPKQNYINQWEDALFELPRFNDVCLVIGITPPSPTRSLVVWNLSNFGDKVRFQKEFVSAEKIALVEEENDRPFDMFNYDWFNDKQPHTREDSPVFFLPMSAVLAFGRECTRAIAKKMGGNFFVRIYDSRMIQYDDDCSLCIGQIRIGSFRRKFYMWLNYWSVKEYEKQWRQAIEYLKTHDETCFIVNIGQDGDIMGASMWMLYKDRLAAYLQDRKLVGEDMQQKVDELGVPFTMETCYSFIAPLPKGGETLKIALSEVLKFKVMPTQLVESTYRNKTKDCHD